MTFCTPAIILMMSLIATGAFAQAPQQEQAIYDLLWKKVTILKPLAAEIERRSMNLCPPNKPKDSCLAKLTMHIEDSPNDQAQDKWQREYFRVYVGESHATHNTRIHTFLVHPRTKEIYAFDVVEETTVPLKTFLSQKRKQKTNY